MLDFFMEEINTKKALNNLFHMVSNGNKWKKKNHITINKSDF